MPDTHPEGRVGADRVGLLRVSDGMLCWEVAVFWRTRRSVALLAIAAIGSVVSPAGVEAAVPGQEVSALPFFSGFTSPTAVSADMRRIVGIDGNTDANWDDIGGWVDHNAFQYLAGQPLTNFVDTDIVFMNGRLGTGTHVLRMTTLGDDPNFTSITRNELSLYSKDPPNDFKEGFVRYWAMLPPDMATRMSDRTRPTPWWVFMEWKEPDSGVSWPADRCAPLGGTTGGTNNYRINVSIRRDAGPSAQFYWHVLAEQVQPCRKLEWEWSNRSVPVPMNGQWFAVGAYLKKHASTGRVYFRVNGQVVLDTDVTRPPGFTGRTQHGANPKPLATWSPLKIYHHEDWWRAGPTTMLYDDFYLSNTIS